MWLASQVGGRRREFRILYVYMFMVFTVHVQKWQILWRLPQPWRISAGATRKPSRSKLRLHTLCYLPAKDGADEDTLRQVLLDASVLVHGAATRRLAAPRLAPRQFMLTSTQASPRLTSKSHRCGLRC